MNTINKFIIFCLLLLSCSKEKNFTFMEAKLNGEAKAMSYTSGESATKYLANDTINYFTILGFNPGVGKIMIEIHTRQLKEMKYYFGYKTDSITLIKATFEDDSTFYSTVYTNPTSYRGVLTITKIETGFVKGTFDFFASTKDTTKRIYVSEGKFYSELK